MQTLRITIDRETGREIGRQVIGTADDAVVADGIIRVLGGAPGAQGAAEIIRQIKCSRN